MVELQLGSSEPKAALAAARYVLQGTQLLGDTDLPRSGPTSPEAVIMAKLRSEARMELEAEGKGRSAKVDLFGIDDEVEDLAQSRLQKAMAEAGLS